MVTYLLVFLTGASLDFLLAAYIQFVANDRLFWAVLFSIGTGACSLYGVTKVVETRALAIPLLVGYGVGTAVAIVVL